MVNLNFFHCFDRFLFTLLTFITLGTISAVLCAAIITLCNLQLTEFDTSILTWVIVAFCISLVALSYSILAQFTLWKYSKLILAIIFTIFDLFLLFCGIAVFILRSKVVKELGLLWTPESSQSAVISYLEESLSCCGFEPETSTHCGNETKSCKIVLEEKMNQYGNIIGGVIFGLFGVLLIGVVLSFIRAFQNSKEEKQNAGPELTDFQEQLNTENAIVWF